MYIYGPLASIFVGFHIFSMNMITTYYKKNKKLFNISLLISIITFIISRIFIILSMKNINPVIVHIILNFAVFVTLILTLLFCKDSFKKIKLKMLIFGLFIFVIGVSIIQLSIK